MSSWISIEDKLPETHGLYHVLREKSEHLGIAAYTYWDGSEWKSGDMDYIAGPIIKWKPLISEVQHERSRQGSDFIHTN